MHEFNQLVSFFTENAEAVISLIVAVITITVGTRLWAPRLVKVGYSQLRPTRKPVTWWLM